MCQSRCTRQPLAPAAFPPQRSSCPRPWPAPARASAFPVKHDAESHSDRCANVMQIMQSLMIVAATFAPCSHRRHSLKPRAPKRFRGSLTCCWKACAAPAPWQVPLADDCTCDLWHRTISAHQKGQRQAHPLLEGHAPLLRLSSRLLPLGLPQLRLPLRCPEGRVH